jgi:hypothetical protein
MSNDDEGFWEAGSALLERDDVTRSTMMGLPCLRVGGTFFAAFDRATTDLLVKLPAARVEQLIAAGEGSPVAPAGRRFREWAAVPPESVDRWPNYLSEACAFVAESA